LKIYRLNIYFCSLIAKVASENLKDKDIGKQLIEDIAKYSAHPDCETLYCFIYDLNQNQINPTGLITNI